MSTNDLSMELRKRGYSVTKPRQVVFTHLLATGPVTMADLCQTLKGIDRASIYRTVGLFEELGFVRRITAGWKYKIELSDIFTAHHHHLQCRNCGKVVDVSDRPSFDAAVVDLAQHYGFRQLSHELEITGICAACDKSDT